MAAERGSWMDETASRPRTPPFGQSLVDTLVMSWLIDRNIDPAGVFGYEIRKSAVGSTIKIELWFDDTPAEAGHHQEGI